MSFRCLFVFIDPLGALWPFIGILVEAIVLFIFIMLYETYKSKKHPKRDEPGKFYHHRDV